MDLTQQKVIKSLPGRTSLRHTVNKFSTSPMIISAGQNDPRGEIAVRFFDRNLNSIQNIVLCGNYYSSRIVAIDEHRILLLLQDGFRAFDMRNVKEELIASSFGVQYPPWEFDGGLVYQKVEIFFRRIRISNVVLLGEHRKHGFRRNQSENGHASPRIQFHNVMGSKYINVEFCG